ncbi:MAG TPA: IclR family transcriptional regulator [Rhizomicrobium sp.]|jgi:DNA-binding IclR family transcriptional regulator|nr:IclR family transcriptional regulator [Rhizomicrobium sp.]
MASKSRPAAPRTRRKKAAAGKRWLGSQTLVRGLEVLEAVAAGVNNLADLAAAVRLNRSTAHRLASTLVERRYLSFMPRYGYGLGPKALEIGYQARMQLNIPRIAREHLEKLAAQTGDTVHLGVRDGNRALYLDKIPGRRRIEISSRVGELQPLRSTGLGKALVLDESETRLRELYRCESGQRYSVPETAWLRRMREYARNGYAFDLEENEDRIRCVAAPIRDATGSIKAAVSVSSAAQYMSDERMRALIEDVRKTAMQISRELGWEARPKTPKTARKRDSLAA